MKVENIWRKSMNIFKSELLKFKKKGMYMLGILAPIPAVVMGINISKRFEGSLGDVSMLQSIFSNAFFMYVGMLLPILILYTVITTSKVESETNGLRNMLLMPIKRSKLFLSKYAMLMSVTIVSLLSFAIEVIIGNALVSNSLQVDFEIFESILFIFLGVLPFLSIVYFIATKFKSMVVPLVAGMLMVLSTIIIAQSDFWIVAPWTYPLVIGMGALESIGELLKIELLSLCIFAAIFAIDLKIFTNKDFI